MTTTTAGLPQLDAEHQLKPMAGYFPGERTEQGDGLETISKTGR